MLARLLRRLASLLAFPAVLAACPGEDAAEDGALVVGVQAEELMAMALIGSVHVVAKVDGVVSTDTVVEIQPNASAGVLEGLPKELELKGRTGARAEVTVDAFTRSLGATPFVSRRATTRLVAAQGKKLLRLQLERRCTDLGTGNGGAGPTPIACPAEQTCAAGQCVAVEVGEGELEDYEPGWATAPPDVCRPKSHGPPELLLGQGQTDYAPLGDGQTLQLEKGPQGGNHIWIAVRMRNLRQSGSRTTLTAKLVDDPTSPILPAGYVFTFDRDEGNYCKLYGLRFQLDSGAADLAQSYKRFLGKRLEVTAEVVDTTGARASATRTINIADKRLCPDGTTTSCDAT